MENKEIEQMAKEISKKSTWVRKGFEDFLQSWSEISECGEHTGIIVGKRNDEYPLFLVTGKNDLQVFDHSFTDAYSDTGIWDILSIKEIRAIIRNLSDILENILQMMKNENKESEEILAILKKLQ